MFKKGILRLATLLALPLAGVHAQEATENGHLFGAHAALRGSGETNVQIGGHLLLPLNTWVSLYPSISLELRQRLFDISAMARFRPFRRRVLSQFYGAAGVATLRDASDTKVVDRLVIGAEWRVGRWTGFAEWEGLEWFASHGSPVPRAVGFLVGFRQRTP